MGNEIFEEKSKGFTEQNQNNLSALLEPLELRINDFQVQSEDNYIKEGKDRAALGGQVRQFITLNQNLSEDAQNVALALKGSSKTQGIYCEVIQERVREASGFAWAMGTWCRSHAREDGTRAILYAIIYPPQARHLVVDSKLSLTAYEEFAVTENDRERRAALGVSQGAHRGPLAEELSGALQSEVFRFHAAVVPIEPAFTLAVTANRDLFMDA